MDIKEFGIIIRDIREKLLDITQKEMAREIQSTQALLSRLENGKGSTPQMIFKVLGFLKKRDINTHLIFSEPFDLDKLLDKEKQIIKQ